MLIKEDKDLIQSYLEDNSNLPQGNTIGVVFPENEYEIIDFFKEVNKKKIPVTISGGGTGTTGGRVPYGGYLVSIERLNRIIDIKEDFVVLQPGVVYKDLEEELSKKKLLFPPNPTEKTSFIGGNIATNASGSRSFKYGVTRDYVKRLRIVLSSGKVLDIKRGDLKSDKNDMFNVNLDSVKLSFRRPMYKMPKTKNAAGYYTKANMDLLDLFIGSEGTLGVITEIELKVIPDFKNLCAFFVFFDNNENAVRLINEVKDSSLSPVAIEYFDKNSLELLLEQYTQLPDKVSASVYIEQDIIGNEDEMLGGWMKIFERYKLPDSRIWFGQTKKDLGLYHEIRHALPERINEIVKKHRHIKLSSDIAVPCDRLDEMIQFYNGKFVQSGIRYFIFGHIGDAHVHTNLLPNTKEQVEQAKDIYIEIMKKAVELGGTISAEHGVGKIKHKYLEIMYGKKGLSEMARVKKVFDSNCILNLDNVFPKNYLA